MAQPPSSETAIPAGRSGRLRRAGFVAALTSAFAGAIALDIPLCPSAALLGLPCPGCGLTRATIATFNGDFHGAFHLHPLVWVITPVYGFALAFAAWSYIRGPENRSAASWTLDRWVTFVAAALLVLVVGVWISRFFGAFGGPAPIEFTLFPR